MRSRSITERAASFSIAIAMLCSPAESQVLLGEGWTGASGTNARLEPLVVGDSYRQRQDWNRLHPLMAIPEEPLPPYPGASISGNVEEVEEIVANMGVLGWPVVVSRVLPHSVWDYKNSPLRVTSREAAKEFGNFNAGAVGLAAGVPVGLSDFGAHIVQIRQNLDYVVRGTYGGDTLGAFFTDDPLGRSQVQAGRDWYVGRQYQEFIRGDALPAPANVRFGAPFEGIPPHLDPNLRHFNDNFWPQTFVPGPPNIPEDPDVPDIPQEDLPGDEPFFGEGLPLFYD